MRISEGFDIMFQKNMLLQSTEHRAQSTEHRAQSTEQLSGSCFGDLVFPGIHPLLHRFQAYRPRDHTRRAPFLLFERNFLYR